MVERLDISSYRTSDGLLIVNGLTYYASSRFSIVCYIQKIEPRACAETARAQKIKTHLSGLLAPRRSGFKCQCLLADEAFYVA